MASGRGLLALGSARSGSGAWLRERLSGLALLPLSLWLVVSAVGLAGAGYGEVRAWAAGPVNAALLLLFLLLAFWHAILGVRVVIEDYVHHEGWKLAALVGSGFGLALLGAVAVVAALQVALGAGG